jgi:alkanesulfonate monooxygenase SsuD/methylene tetrahydromethanopterin reductase-like flavin-dependent oxidoreductase (luciferase family)
MIGGGGKKLLEIAAADADIASLAPPIINGKDMIQDPAAAVKFDKANLRKRIDILRGFVKDAGRAPDAVEVGGFAMVGLSRDKHQADAILKRTASQMGFPSDGAARNAPTLLIGTPDEVKRELRSRIQEFGMSYFITFPTSVESRDLLASEIMSEFGA